MIKSFSFISRKKTKRVVHQKKEIKNGIPVNVFFR